VARFFVAHGVYSTVASAKVVSPTIGAVMTVAHTQKLTTQQQYKCLLNMEKYTY